MVEKGIKLWELYRKPTFLDSSNAPLASKSEGTQKTHYRPPLTPAQMTLRVLLRTFKVSVFTRVTVGGLFTQNTLLKALSNNGPLY